MRRRRARAMKGRTRRPASAIDTHDLCRGPGNLTMAMGITLAENRLDLLGARLFVEDRGIDAGRDRVGTAHRDPGGNRHALARLDRGAPCGVCDPRRAAKENTESDGPHRARLIRVVK